MNILIIGYGEIGSSLHKVYKDKETIFNVSIQDHYINKQADLTKKYDVVEICIPYNNTTFINTVSDYLNQIETDLVIINSTTQVGTTKKLKHFNPTKNIVHSPVRGVHPNLKEGIQTFIRYVGYDDNDSLELIKNHYNKLGLLVEYVEGSETTEYLKLVSTTQYGYLIAMYAELEQLHQFLNEKPNINLEKEKTNRLLQHWNETYNEGYIELGMSNVTRPILYAPPTGKIGGHCIIPNTKILKEWGNFDLLNMVLKYS